MLRVTFSNSALTAPKIIDGKSVAIRGDRLLVDGELVATKWPVTDGPWIDQNRAAWMCVEVTSRAPPQEQR